MSVPSNITKLSIHFCKAFAYKGNKLTKPLPRQYAIINALIDAREEITERGFDHVNILTYPGINVNRIPPTGLNEMRVEFRNPSLRMAGMHQRGYFSMEPDRVGAIHDAVVEGAPEPDVKNKPTRKPGMGGEFVIREPDGRWLEIPNGWPRPDPDRIMSPSKKPVDETGKRVFAKKRKGMKG